MTDPTTPDPIIVNTNTSQTQLVVLIRQVGAALIVIFGTLGATAWAAKLGVVVSLAPQIAVLLTVLGSACWVAITWIGQLFTRRQAKALAIMVPYAPDEVAKVKSK